MKLADIIKLSLNNLSHRGLRSWLTIIGIVIGVAAVVAIISMGTGMEQSISTQLGGLGADVVTITSGFSRATGMGFAPEWRERTTATSESQELTNMDIQIIKFVPGVQYVNGIVSDRVEISYLTETTSVSIEGVDPLAWKEITTSELESGRYLIPSDANFVVVGYRIANEMFKEPLMINTQIIIEGKSFKIVGILEESGGGFGPGGGGDDNTIFMTTNAARTIIEDMDKNQYSSIQVKVTDAESVDEIIANMEQKCKV